MKLRLLGRALEPRQLLELVGARHLRWINQNFRDAGTERSWKPLAAGTVAARRKGRGAGSAQPLRDTGRLAMSFVVTRRGSSFIEVGTNVEYARWHQEGTGPYVIRPKTTRARGADGKFHGGVLAFGPKGQKVFARLVNHPGLPVRALLPSAGLADRVAKRALQEYVDAAVVRAGLSRG